MSEAGRSDADATLRKLRALIIERSVRTGDFVLSSGARSTYYIDGRRTTMSGTGQLLIGRAALDAIDHAGWQPIAVGGLTLGADPVAYAIAHAAAARGRALDAFTVRKEAKAHGTGRRIEGAFPDDEGAAVVVVEDVMTSGASALRAAAAVREASAVVLGILTVVDREEGGRESLARAGYELVSLFTASALLEGTTAV